jgi:hypothetical protein
MDLLADYLIYDTNAMYGFTGRLMGCFLQNVTDGVLANITLLMFSFVVRPGTFHNSTRTDKNASRHPVPKLQ